MPKYSIVPEYAITLLTGKRLFIKKDDSESWLVFLQKVRDKLDLQSTDESHFCLDIDGNTLYEKDDKFHDKAYIDKLMLKACGKMHLIFTRKGIEANREREKKHYVQKYGESARRMSLETCRDMELKGANAASSWAGYARSWFDRGTYKNDVFKQSYSRNLNNSTSDSESSSKRRRLL